MILLLLKVTLLLAMTLIAVGAMQRSSAAMRHLICACGLAGALLLALTLLVPYGTPAFRIQALTVPSTARVVRSAPVLIAPLLRILPWIWLAGMAGLLCRIALGYWHIAQLKRKAGRAEILYTDVSVPFVVGLVRPVILLPRAANTWPAGRIDAALRHERAHVRRKDLWTLLLGHLTCAVYWFHPLAWMVAAQLRREQEQACDDAVILSGFEPASYAEALMAAAQTLTSTRLIGCPMVTQKMLSQKTFRSRIARLLGNGMPRVSSPSTLRRAAIVFAGAVITIGLVSGQQAQEPGRPDQNGAYKVGGGVSAPSVKYRTDPEYTEEAKDAKVAGTVLLSIVVGTDGQAHYINVVKGLGSGLDEKAVEAVQKWSFNPGRKDGQPVEVRAQIEINFKLM